MTMEEVGHEVVWLVNGGLHPEMILKALNRSGRRIQYALRAIDRDDLSHLFENYASGGKPVKRQW